MSSSATASTLQAGASHSGAKLITVLRGWPDHAGKYVHEAKGEEKGRGKRTHNKGGFGQQPYVLVDFCLSVGKRGI